MMYHALYANEKKLAVNLSKMIKYHRCSPGIFTICILVKNYKSLYDFSFVGMIDLCGLSLKNDILVHHVTI